MCYEILRIADGSVDYSVGYFANSTERAWGHNARSKKKTADENHPKRRVAGAGQVLGTASLFGVRVREQPPSITGGSWHLERYIDSPHPRIESNAAGKNTNEQNRTLWSMLRPPKFIGEWVTVAGLVYCSSILGDSAPIHFPFWLQKYRRFTDVTVNSCLRLQIEFSANPGEGGMRARDE